MVWVLIHRAKASLDTQLCLEIYIDIDTPDTPIAYNDSAAKQTPLEDPEFVWHTELLKLRSGLIKKEKSIHSYLAKFFNKAIKMQVCD